MSRNCTLVILLGIAALAVRIGLSVVLGLSGAPPEGSDQYDYARYASNLIQGKGYVGPEPGQVGDVPSA